jgi:alpha/beta superfamily hydrolase
VSGLAGNTFFDGPAGRIEAILKEPPGEVTRAAIVCHPHPLFGGTMHNKVVFRIARAFQAAGFAVLRFNFRGTGSSEGTHDNGVGEQDDLRAALAFLLERYPAAEIWVSGFSFGAAIAVRVGCEEPAVKALVAAGMPVSRHDFSPLAHCQKPKLFVQGSMDEFAAVSDLNALLSRVPGEKDVRIVEGADHFFEGHLAELVDAVSAFIGR